MNVSNGEKCAINMKSFDDFDRYMYQHDICYRLTQCLDLPELVRQ